MTTTRHPTHSINFVQNMLGKRICFITITILLFLRKGHRLYIIRSRKEVARYGRIRIYFTREFQTVRMIPFYNALGIEQQRFVASSAP